MSDRTLGYSAILFLIIFLFIPAGYFASKALAPTHHRTIVFDSINTGSFLRIQDPVRMKGFEVGLIQNIAWDNGKTMVKIETASPLAIHQGYDIIAEAKGLMGDRYLEIEPGASENPIVDTKELLYGRFPLGPTEAIAFMYSLKDAVDSIVRITAILNTGSDEMPSFGSRFHSIARSLDTTETALLRAFRQADRLVGDNVDSLAALMRKANTFSRQFDSTVPAAMSSMDTAIHKTEQLLVDADTLVAVAGRLAKKANGPETADLSKTFVKLKAQIETVRDALIEIKKKGVVLPVRL